MLHRQLNREHLAGALDNVLGADGGPVDFGRVALAEEVDATLVEVERVIVDGQLVGVSACTVGRVVADRVQEIGEGRGGVVDGDDWRRRQARLGAGAWDMGGARKQTLEVGAV